MSDTISSNDSSLYIGRQDNIREIPNPLTLYGVKPNSYSSFGGSITRTARAPISSDAQNLFGVIVAMDAQSGFQVDMTHEGAMRALQSFFFADPREMPSTQPINGTSYAVEDVDEDADTYITNSASGTIFVDGDLVYASGFSTPANNGLKLVDDMTDGVITVGDGLVDETPGADAQLTGCGFQFEASDINISYADGVAKLTSTSTTFTEYDQFIPGAWVYLGSDDAGSRFVNNNGYCRIKSVAAKELVFDDTTFTPQAETGSGKTIQIYIPHILKNETDTSLKKTIPLLMERTLGVVDGETQCEYIVGAVGDSLTINFPEAEKLNADLGFVAIDTFQRTGQGDNPRLTATRVPANEDDAFNGTSDLYRCIVKVNNDTNPNADGLFGFVMSGNVAVNNSVSRDKALGHLSAIGVSKGNFVATGTFEVYFSSVEAQQAIYANKKCSFNIITAAGNRGFVVDMPLVGLGTADVNVTKDQSMKISLPIEGAKSDKGFTMSYQVFPYLPDAAMPVQDTY